MTEREQMKLEMTKNLAVLLMEEKPGKLLTAISISKIMPVLPRANM